MIFGSLTALISLIIIAIHFVLKTIAGFFNFHSKSKNPPNKKLNVVMAIIVLIFIPIALFVIYQPIFNNLVHEDNNFELIENALYECTTLEISQKDKYVILRLDDVQSGAWTSISIKMMNDVLERNLPIVAGIIPKYIEEDKIIKQFFKKNDCKVEIAIHGYDHGSGEYGDSNGEFAFLNQIDTKEKIALAKQSIAKISDQNLNIFIPPNNQISDEARATLKESDFIISSEGEDYYDYDSATWDFGSNSFINAEETIANCELAFSTGDNLCVIMIHPQDFSNNDMSINEDSYAEFTKILDYLESSNISVTTFNKMSAR